ncbi:hypothetical protein KIPB_000401 [Kipferlia bialata]|uniref:Uncharacterized protein n=1 Tax=Kipferlia bialata TaxID=797122 RepID=A0A9K3CP61_9EUKA|nr:hypothetical protein KIPB_000401 [Kipferlia bialata]|eukprot:g401.t1
MPQDFEGLGLSGRAMTPLQRESVDAAEGALSVRDATIEQLERERDMLAEALREREREAVSEEEVSLARESAAHARQTARLFQERLDEAEGALGEAQAMVRDCQQERDRGRQAIEANTSLEAELAVLRPLADQAREMQVEVGTTRERLAVLQTEAQELRASLGEAQDTLAQERQTLSTMVDRQELARVEETLQETQGRGLSLSTSLSTAQAQVVSLSSSLQRAEERATELGAREAALATELSEQRESAGETGLRLSEAQAQVLALRDSLDDTRERLRAATQEATDLRERLGTATTSLASIEASAQAARETMAAERERAERDVQRLTEQLAEATQQVATLQAALSDAKFQLAVQADRQTDEDGREREREMSGSELRGRLAEAETGWRQGKHQVADLEVALAKAERERDDALEACARDRDRMQQLDADVQAVTVLHREATASLATCTQRAEGLEASAERAEERCADIQTRAQETEAALRAEVQAQTERLAEATGRCGELDTYARAVYAEYLEVSVAFEKLQARVQELEGRQVDEATTQQLSSLSSQIDALNVELQEREREKEQSTLQAEDADALRRHAAEVTARYDAAEQELGEARQTLLRLKDELRDVLAERDAQTDTAQALSAQAQTLSADVACARAALASVAEALSPTPYAPSASGDKADADADRWGSVVEGVTRAVADAVRVPGLEQDRDRLLQELQGEAEAASQAMAELTRLDQERQSLTGEVEEGGRQRQSLQGEVEALAQRERQCRRQVQDLEAEVERGRVGCTQALQRVSALEASEAELQSGLAATARQRDELTRELEAVSERLVQALESSDMVQQVRARNATLEARLSAAENSLRAAVDTAQGTASELGGLRHRLAVAEAKSLASASGQSDSEAAHKEMEREREALTARALSAEQRLREQEEGTKRVTDQLQVMLEAATSQLQVRTDDLAHQSARVQSLEAEMASHPPLEEVQALREKERACAAEVAALREGLASTTSLVSDDLTRLRGAIEQGEREVEEYGADIEATATGLQEVRSLLAALAEDLDHETLGDPDSVARVGAGTAHALLALSRDYQETQ